MPIDRLAMVGNVVAVHRHIDSGAASRARLAWFERHHIEVNMRHWRRLLHYRNSLRNWRRRRGLRRIPTRTKITFKADSSIMDVTKYNFDTLATRLRELAF